MLKEDANQNFIASHIGKPVKNICLRHACKAFSYLAAVSLGYFSVEGIAWGTENQEKDGGNPVLILPQSKEAYDPYTAAQPESYESYQIRILRNQNNLQADKIRTLREEIMELNRKIHELTPHLFTKGDPLDKEKIANLSIKLTDRERELNDALALRARYEQESTHAKKKLSEMETIKEALAEMVEKQRYLRDQNTQEFKKQIENLQTAAAYEKDSLIKKIREHEAIRQNLEGDIAEKRQTIVRLDTLATQQDYMLTANELKIKQLNEQILNLYSELLTTASAYATHQQAMQEQLLALSEALNWEEALGENLSRFKDKMNWISDLYEGTNAFLNDEIDSLKQKLAEQEIVKAELQSLKSHLNEKKQEISWLLQAHQDYKIESTSYLNLLDEALAEKEKEANSQLELVSGLLLHLDDAQMGLEYDAEFQQNLEELLAAATVLLEDRRQEVLKLESSLSQTRAENEKEANGQLEMIGGLLLHLDDAQMGLEYNAEFQQNLEELLAAATVLLEDRRQEVIKLENSLSEALENYGKEQLIVSTLEVETNSYKNIVEELGSSLAKLERKRLKENNGAANYFAYLGYLLDETTILSYQLELIFEDLYQDSLFVNRKLAQDLAAKETELELALQTQGQLESAMDKLERRALKDNAGAVDYLAHMDRLLADSGMLTCQLQLIFEDLNRGSERANRKLAGDLAAKEIELELAVQTQIELEQALANVETERENLILQSAVWNGVKHDSYQKQAKIAALLDEKKEITFQLQNALNQWKSDHILSYQLEMMLEDANEASSTSQQQMNAELQARLDRISEMEQTIVNLEDSFEQLKNDNSLLTEKAIESNEWKEKSDLLSQTTLALQDKHQKLQKELANYLQHTEQLTLLAIQLEMMLDDANEASLQENLALNADLEAKIQELKNVYQNLTSLELSHKALADELEETKNELEIAARLKAIVQEKEEAIASLEQQKEEFLHNLDENFIKLNETSALADQYKNLMDEKLQTIEELKQKSFEEIGLRDSEIKKLMSAHQELKNQLDQLEEENILLAEAQDSLDDWKNRNEHQVETISHLQAQIEKNLHSLKDAEEKLEKMAVYSRELESAIGDSYQHLSMIEQRAADELHSKNQLLDLAAQEKYELQAQLHSLDEENYHLTEHAAGLEKWKIESHAKDEWIAKLQSQLDTEKAITASLQSDLNYARMNFVQEQRTRRNLEQLYHEERQKLTSLENKIKQNAQEIASRDHFLSQSEISYEYLLMQLKDLTDN